MRSTVFSDIILTCHNHKPPSDEEWDVYVQQIRETVQARSGFRNLVVTDGGGPNPVQRRRAADATQGSTSPVAVVSSRAMVRGIVTALHWIARVDIRSFHPVQLEAAMAHLKISAAEAEQIKA